MVRNPRVLVIGLLGFGALAISCAAPDGTEAGASSGTIGSSASDSATTVVDRDVCLMLQEYVETRPVDPPAALKLLEGVRDRSPQALRPSIEVELQVLLLLVNGYASGDVVETDAQGNQVLVQAGSIPTDGSQIDASHAIGDFVATEC